MKFHFRGADYSIEFRRERQEVTIRATGEIVQSTHPYTTVTILKHTTSWPEGVAISGKEVFRTASAGVLKGDTFTHSKGRLAALRAVSRSMTNEKDFKKAMWTAYSNRKKTE